MSDVKKRGLGRGLDALFRDVKSDEQSFRAAHQPAAKTETPAPAKRAENTSKRDENTAAPVKRADEMLRAAEALQAQQQDAPVENKMMPNAAAQSQAVETKSLPSGVRRIAIEKLSPGKFQPRHHFDENALQQLAESIGVHGILQPLLVRGKGNGTYEIIAGERRWRAAQLAKLHDVPVVVQDLDDKQALEIALIENLQREDLSAVEEAEGYQRLINEFGHTQEVIAEQLGKSRSHVANTLRLLKLPQSVRQMVLTGDISAGHARALVGAKNPDELADAILKRNLSVRQTEQLVQKSADGKLKAKTKKTKGFVEKNVDLLALEQKITSTLGLKTTLDTQNNGLSGKVVVEYKSLDQLDDLVARLTAPRKKSI